jgi:hypothetical protein
MLKTVFAACALLCALSFGAEARPRPGPWQSCVPSSDPMRPAAICQPSFLAGVKSIRVKMHRVRAQAISGRPAACPPRAWCGCFLAHYLGISKPGLWRARQWAYEGNAAGGPQPGAVVVWPHHVGLIRAVEGNKILVLSGNDGHAVRVRWRSTSGVIAYRQLGA